MLGAGLAGAAGAAPKVVPPDHWVGTWGTAPYALEPGAVLTETGLGTVDMTIREVVHTSLGGALARVELTNEFGTEPLTIGAVHLALAGANAGDISLLSANALTFGGKPSITIPAGAIAMSDPAAIAVPAGGDVVVSLFIPAQKMGAASFHSSAFETNFLVPGNVVGSASLTAPKTTQSWFFLRAVDVRTAYNTGAVVVFGDSITDGAGSTAHRNMRWPDVLARRLQGNKKTAGLGVLNMGIGGNRILHDVTGVNALARFDHDVLAQSGVRYVMILEGINDIGHAQDPVKPYDVVSAEELIQGLSQMVERAHAHGIKVILATLTPYMGAGYASPAGEEERQAVNAWIRTTKSVDGFVDFDKATQDPSKPDTLRADFHAGDFLHPKDAGYQAMGDAIDLKLFDPNPKESYDIRVKLK